MDVLLFLNALLLSRLVYIFRDQPLRTPSLVLLGIIQALLCLIVFTFGWPALSLAILCVLALLLSERWLSDNWMNESRLLGLVIVLLAAVALQNSLSLSLWTETALLQTMRTLGFAAGTPDLRPRPLVCLRLPDSGERNQSTDPRPVPSFSS